MLTTHTFLLNNLVCRIDERLICEIEQKMFIIIIVLGLLFYFAYKTFINTADEIIEKKGMSRQHHRFLFFIDKVPGITIRDLLKSMEISKQGSHQTLRKLKEEGLVVEKKFLLLGTLVDNWPFLPS